MANAEHKIDYIKRCFEVIIEIYFTECKKPEYNELLSEFVQGRYSLAKDFLEVINDKR